MFILISAARSATHFWAVGLVPPLHGHGARAVSNDWLAVEDDSKCCSQTNTRWQLRQSLEDTPSDLVRVDLKA